MVVCEAADECYSEKEDRRNSSLWPTKHEITGAMEQTQMKNFRGVIV